MLFLIAYPIIDPVLVRVGPLPIRWYALAYIAGLVRLAAGAYAQYLVRPPALWGEGARPDSACIDDVLVYAAIGVILGGRLGYVLFYNLPFFLAHPLAIVQLWQGGMSFHGGFAGTALAVARCWRGRGDLRAAAL